MSRLPPRINMNTLTPVELERLHLFLPQVTCTDCLGTGYRIDDETVEFIDLMLQLGNAVAIGNLPNSGQKCSCLDGFRYLLCYN